MWTKYIPATAEVYSMYELVPVIAHEHAHKMEPEAMVDNPWNEVANDLTTDLLKMQG